MLIPKRICSIDPAWAYPVGGRLYAMYMTFTPLHRAAGATPGPLTEAILDAAIAASALETDDLDWKSTLPQAKGLPLSDFPKDIAAMANSGGGVLVYGVQEKDKAAVARTDVGNLDEIHERALRSAAITAISPPVFGLIVHRLGAEGSQAVVIEIPASVDGPHLVYRNELFGAPRRNDADTVWMKERQIEAMYRARFDERRHATEALDSLYREMAVGRDTGRRAWLVTVAHPRIPDSMARLTRDEARGVFSDASQLALVYAGRGGIHPLEGVDRDNPRPGLRRWNAVNTGTDKHTRWREAWVNVHHDGSVALATAIGGHRKSSDNHFEGREVESAGIECAIADLMALVRRVVELVSVYEYEIRVGIEWNGTLPLIILTTDVHGFTYNGVSIPLHDYTPVTMTVNAAESDLDYYWHVHDLARDCVNQGGVSNLRLISPPERDSQPNGA